MSNTEKLSYKRLLKAYCLSILQQRADNASIAMKEAQEAANAEGKSSAGDKYETGRAMNQIERDNQAGRLDEALRDLAMLHSVDTDRIYDHAGLGAVIFCGESVYFIAAGLGPLTWDTTKIIVISPKAPLSNLLKGKTVGEELTINGKTMKITDVF